MKIVKADKNNYNIKNIMKVLNLYMIWVFGLFKNTMDPFSSWRVFIR